MLPCKNPSCFLCAAETIWRQRMRLPLFFPERCPYTTGSNKSTTRKDESGRPSLLPPILLTTIHSPPPLYVGTFSSYFFFYLFLFFYFLSLGSQWPKLVQQQRTINWRPSLLLLLLTQQRVCVSSTIDKLNWTCCSPLLENLIRFEFGAHKWFKLNNLAPSFFLTYSWDAIYEKVNKRVTQFQSQKEKRRKSRISGFNKKKNKKK